MLRLSKATLVVVLTAFAVFAFAGSQNLLLGHQSGSMGSMGTMGSMHQDHNHDTQGIMGGGMMKHMGGMMGNMQGMMMQTCGTMMQQMGGIMQLDNMLGYRDELNLTQDQIGKIKGLLVDVADNTGEIQSDLRTQDRKLSELLDAKNWDMSAIKKQVQSIESLRGDLQIATLEQVNKAENLLTADQRKKLDELGLDYCGADTGMMSMGSGSMHGGAHSHSGGMMGGGSSN